MTAQTAADLRAAADVLERDGWTQDSYINFGTRCRCAVGAIMGAVDPRARRLGELGSDGLRRVVTAEMALSHHIGALVLDWNDQENRTADEVITALRAAADRAEQESGR